MLPADYIGDRSRPLRVTGPVCRPKRRFVRNMIVHCLQYSRFVALGLIAAIAACASKPAVSTVERTNGTTIVAARGDWNDVPASVYASISTAEVAILSESSSETSYTFELLSILDQNGRLTVARAIGSPSERVNLTLTCSIGLLGDPVREETLVRAVAARLKELEGVDYRPRP